METDYQTTALESEHRILPRIIAVRLCHTMGQDLPPHVQATTHPPALACSTATSSSRTLCTPGSSPRACNESAPRTMTPGVS